MSIDPTTIELTTAREPSSRRAGAGGVRIAAVVVATLLLVGALVFMFGAFGERDDAEADRREAATAVRTARERADRADARLTVTRTDLQNAIGTVDDLLASVDDLARLGDRSVELAAVAQDSGANNSIARLDEYNDNVSRHNEVVDQWDAIITDLLERVDALVPGTVTA